MGRKALGRLSTADDDRRNAVIAATTAVKRWLGQTPAGAFAAPATFTRKP
jgi:hypothetical protein